MSSSRKGRSGNGFFNNVGGGVRENSSTSPTRLPLTEIPEARLGPDVADVAENTEILGSTQLTSVCPGDFCNYTLLDTADGDSSLMPTSMSRSVDGLSGFRRKIMLSDPLLDRTFETLNGKDPVSSSGDNKLQDRSDVKATISATRKLRSNENAQLGASDPGPIIPLSSIIQARQEMTLVKQQLARHRKGEVGDYLTDESQLNVAHVAGKMAAHYYQNVHVCGELEIF